MERDPRQAEPARVQAAAPEAQDPLRLCIFATVALLGWILGPIALVGFATLGFVGYWRARRAGLLKSRCVLGDTRVVLVYLAILVVVGAVGIGTGALGWLR
ncbi:hypothetical protein BJ980_001049 [Nocardioides daedukensis]|uniref:Uncharacterized protein n=1 Tax=Nocardioides daedukensis TaxID=634462 RepID=A0A7Y9RZ48_9ACTN|nr:hypothetical protein [Nocardioides daedukensis]NYG58126.1 hypothetical protein [Nocardioides daedukensis]